MSNKMRVNWLTNLPAPYRIPIWEQVGKNFDLRIYSYLGEKNSRGWTSENSEFYKHQFLGKKIITAGETEFAPNPFGSISRITAADYLIVAGWEIPIYCATLLVGRIKKIPTLLFYESTPNSHRFKGPLIRLIRRSIFNLADGIVTSGSSSTQAVLNTGIKREKIIELFNPVDVSYFANYSSSHRVESHSGHRFLYVGQLIARKNVESLIRAFNLMKSPDDTLTIAGDGELRSTLQRLVTSLDLEKQITFVGHQNQQQIADLHAHSDTLVMPSTNEVWGLVANEALASGLHVIVSDVAGVAEFIEKMKGAYLCKTDSESIAEMMRVSKADYKGPIKNPEILGFTPERFADELVEVIY